MTKLAEINFFISFYGEESFQHCLQKTVIDLLNQVAHDEDPNLLHEKINSPPYRYGTKRRKSK